MPETDPQQSTKSQQGGPSITDGLLDALHPNTMLNNAQKVISSAVNVLEAEIAAGILAAKQMERKVLDVDDLRSNPENLMNRIRRDSHEALDIFLDAFSALSRQIGLLTDAVASENGRRTGTQPVAKKPVSPVQLLEPDEPAIAGQQVRYHFSLCEDSISSPVGIGLQKTDFTGPGVSKIPSRLIQLNPDSLTLHPGKEKEITAIVSVPKTCKPGHYNALLTVAQMPAVKIVLSLEVK